MTAAHCTKGFTASQLRVAVNDVKYNASLSFLQQLQHLGAISYKNLASYVILIKQKMHKDSYSTVIFIKFPPVKLAMSELFQ